MIINAGIEKVVIRNSPDTYESVDVRQWVRDDDSLSGKFGY
jgi:dCMP deaminase